MPLVDQVKRKPRDQEIKAVSIAEQAQECTPSGTLIQDLQSGRLPVCLAQRSQPWTAGHPAKPRQQPEQAGKTEHDKERPPAESGHENPPANMPNAGPHAS